MPTEVHRRDVRPRHVGRRPAPEQRERVLCLVADDPEHLLHSLRAAEREPEHRPDDHEDGARAECERCHDVGAAANAAVEVDLGPAVHRFDDLGERLERRDRAVELAAAVVRDDDSRLRRARRPSRRPRP